MLPQDIKPIELETADSTAPESVFMSGLNGSSQGSGTAIVSEPSPQHYSNNSFNKRWMLWLSGAVLLVIILFGIVGFMAAQVNKRNVARQQAEQQAQSEQSSYPTMTLPLQDLIKDGQVTLGSDGYLAVNGQLKVSESITLAPTTAPQNAVAGQIYFDAALNKPVFYDGNSYQQVAVTNNVVSSIQGQAGPITLGPGLYMQNGVIGITNPYTPTTPTAPVVTPQGVTSFQGQTGAIALFAGSGIDVNGTTITNTGVVSIAGANGNVSLGKGLSVTGSTINSTTSITSLSSTILIGDDGNGNFTITEQGSGAGGTVALGPVSPQQDSSTNPSININKTAAGNLVELAYNTNNQFVVNQNGAITVGTIAYSQVTGSPTNLVNTIGGVSGAISLGQGLSIAGNTLVNAGVASLAGTANQVTVSNIGGAYTLALPQDIAVSSSPTFANLTLTNALPVASGGTGANNATTARSNLGAAASGANGDITSLTGLSSITPTGTLSIGATTQNLVLQGSANTSISATDNGFSTTLTFVQPTAGATITIPNATGTLCLSSGNCLGGAGGGANTSLSNLQSVALNTNLLPASNGIDIGSISAPFRDLYLLGTGTSYAKLTSAATAPQTVTLPNASGTVCLSSGNCVGSGVGGAVGGNGTNGTLPIWTGSGYSLGDSLISQNSGTVLINGGKLAAGGINESLSLSGNGAGGVILEKATFYGASGASYTFDSSDTALDNGVICTTIGNCLGSGGAVAGSGVNGTIPLWTGSGFSLTNSVLNQSGGNLSTSGQFSANGLSAGTGSISGSGGLTITGNTNLSGNLATSGSLTLSNLTGAGNQCLTTNGSGLVSLTSCLSGTNGVASLNGLTGSLSINNATTAGSSITINDATTSIKGIASFNSTNFTTSSGVVNTVQNINTSAAPTFSALSLTSPSGAPFTVASTTKVSGLNADLLDGMDSTAFGDATAANQTAILSRIGTNADASGTTSLFARLARIDDTDLGATGDSASSTGTIFARLSDLTNRITSISNNIGTTSDSASNTGTIFARLADLYNRVVSLNTSLGSPTDVASNATTASAQAKLNWLLANSGAGGGDATSAKQDQIISLLTTPKIVTGAPDVAVNNAGGTLYGELTNIGATAITAYGFVYATTTDPTLSNSVITAGSTTVINKSFSAPISGLMGTTMYYVRAYATTASGTVYGNQRQLYTSTGSVGDLAPDGVGRIIYDAGSTQSWGRYIESFPEDIDTSMTQQNAAYSTWYWCSVAGGAAASTNIGTLTAIGTGASNTNLMKTNCNTPQARDTITALNGVNNGTIGNNLGYSDWFIPSRDELLQLYAQRIAVGGFTSNVYWSSSEYVASLAYIVSFSSGTSNVNNKTTSTNFLRPVRAF